MLYIDLDIYTWLLHLLNVRIVSPNFALLKHFKCNDIRQSNEKDVIIPYYWYQVIFCILPEISYHTLYSYFIYVFWNHERLSIYHSIFSVRIHACWCPYFKWWHFYWMKHGLFANDATKRQNRFLNFFKCNSL